ncbi:hypothetical protein DdX_01919 [Ditylenchus destructor]|uniref:Uncharacterized protein n=1 Tax=Ditylenchus destructor TaxID=166010 RepID=A0AAD4RBT5_9BILA|nr:hypothetical protein DdX_01919 [Ditylenchus destructor]
MRINSSPMLSYRHKCPCVMKPGTTECLQYDTHYQAVTLEEAIASFNDIILEHELTAPETVRSPEEEQCQTKHCINCQKKLRKKLAALGLLAHFIENSAEKTNEEAAEICTKYHFTRANQAMIYEYGKPKPPKNLSGMKIGPLGGPPLAPPQMVPRSKRQTNTTNVSQPVVGTRYNLSCVLKGSSADSNGFISLCSKCWAWRQLPINYFPRFVNEMVCDDQDKSCLSSYAECSTGTRAFEVIRNDSAKLTTVMLTAGSFCECKIKQGSALQSLGNSC